MKKSWVNFGFVAVMAAFVFYSCGEDTPGIQGPELPKQASGVCMLSRGSNSSDC